MDDIQLKRKQRRKRQRRRRMIFRLILVVIFLLILTLIYFKFIKSDDNNKVSKPVKNEVTWNTMLINKENTVPDSYKSVLVDVDFEDKKDDESYKKVDFRIYSSLKEMFEAAKEDGVNLRISSAYRSRFEQNKILAKKISAYEHDGFSHKKAEKEALKWVAKPGYSEHETGLAVDINRKGRTSSKVAYKWLSDNGYKYGFIKRYPNNKKDITGISNEPWHYRYVGSLISRICKQNDICLEELDDLLKEK